MAVSHPGGRKRLQNVTHRAHFKICRFLQQAPSLTPLSVRIVKIIKFYAWELAIEDKVKQLRNQEQRENFSKGGPRVPRDSARDGVLSSRSWHCSCATSFGTWPGSRRWGGSEFWGGPERAGRLYGPFIKALFLSFSLSPVLVALGGGPVTTHR